MGILTNYDSKIKDAIEAKDIDKFSEAVDGRVQAKAEAMIQEALNAQDANILQARGKRALTSKERTYWNKLISAMKSPNFRSAVSDTNLVMPDETIEQIFTDLTDNHELLKYVNVKQAKAKTEIYFAVTSAAKATWGDLDAEITQEATASFKVVNIYQKKLSAFVAIPEAILDLGPEWMDRFVRTILGEMIANGLEDGILNNLNTKTGPIGMIANLENGTANSSGGGITYTAKTAKAVKEWSPEGFKAVLATLAKTQNGHYRKTEGNLFMVVNPEDYYSIVKPAISFLTPSGTWATTNPMGIDIVQSIYVQSGKAVIGVKNAYLLGLGTAEAGKLEASDEYDFLKDKRTYKTKLYASGMPLDNTAFQLLTITNLKAPLFQASTPAAAADEDADS